MFLLILQRLGVGLRETFHLEYLGDILPIDEDIGHEAIVDSLAAVAYVLVEAFCEAQLSYSPSTPVCESRCP
jgi:hypothetical protein